MADQLQSQLPDDPDYWDGLAGRIREDARSPLAAYAAAEPWYGWLDRAAPWIAAGSAAAMLLLWFALPTAEPEVDLWIERSVTPDEVAGAMVSGSEPPNVEVLLAQFPPRGMLLPKPGGER